MGNENNIDSCQLYMDDDNKSEEKEKLLKDIFICNMEAKKKCFTKDHSETQRKHFPKCLISKGHNLNLKCQYCHEKNINCRWENCHYSCSAWLGE